MSGTLNKSMLMHDVPTAEPETELA